MNCPKCGCQKQVKNGFIKGVQRFKCKDCACQYTRSEPRGRPVRDKLMAVTLYVHGMSLNTIGKLMNVSTPGVLDWVRRFSRKHFEKAEPTGEGPLLLELDEMWHYLKKKRTKLWIWKVLDSVTGKLLEWECGDRSAQTLERLYERIKNWNVQYFCTDHWEAYAKIIPSHKLVMSKKLTIRIEQNNGRQRHWFGRFRRKSIIVSKSLEMVDLSIFLFAAIHVNKTLKMPSLLA